jgi:hypothetical protein
LTGLVLLYIDYKAARRRRGKFDQGDMFKLTSQCAHVKYDMISSLLYRIVAFLRFFFVFNFLLSVSSVALVAVECRRNNRERERTKG